jgi:hypothetical protein
MNGKRERWNGIEQRQPLVAPAPKGIIDPNTGKPVGRTTRFSAKSTTNWPTRAFSSRPRTT